MTTREKQLQKLTDRRQDANWTYAEMVGLLSACGYAWRSGKGSHQIFAKGSRRVVIACHGKTLRRETVRDVREIYQDMGL